MIFEFIGVFGFFYMCKMCLFMCYCCIFFVFKICGLKYVIDVFDILVELILIFVYFGENGVVL